MYYSEELVEQVRRENDIVDIIGGYVRLKKSGSNYFGLCPFHSEKSPSFSVSPHKQMYYCFGCGEGGNVVSFLMKYENYTFIEALKVLAERAGINLPEPSYSRDESRNKEIKNQIIEANTKAALYYHNQLRGKSGAAAYRYLKDRKLTDETIIKFGLGCSDRYGNGLYNYLKSEGYSDEILRECQLFNYDEKNGFTDKFWNRVMFPIFDANGKVIAFGGRVLGDSKPKYLNSPETKVFDKSRNLYGLNFARRSRAKYMLICEGYMDVISLHQAGFDNAVAALGTSFNAQHASVLRRYTKDVVLTFDSDGAGRNAAMRAIPYLRSAGISVKVLDMTPYKDPDEFIKSRGVEEYRERIDKAENYFLFMADHVSKDYDMSDPSSKTRFHNELAKMLLDFDDDLERSNYLEAVSERFNIDKSLLESLVKKKALTYVPKEDKEVYVNRQESTSKSQKSEPDYAAQRIILSAIMDHNDWFGAISKVVTPDDFRDEFLQKVARRFWQQMEEGSPDPAGIMDYFTDEEEHKKVAGLFVSPFDGSLSIADMEKALSDAAKTVKKNSLDAAYKNATDIAQMQKLLDEQKRVKDIKIRLV